MRDVLSAVIQIGRGSSNVAQALRAHFGFSERLLSNRATPGERAEWFPRVNSGVVVGNAITDAAGRAPSSADTKVLPDTAGVLRLNGYKFYSTGTLFADVIAVSALDAEGRDLQVIIPADRAGVELFDDWDGFGQRTTASGGTRFTDVGSVPKRSSPSPTATPRVTAPGSCSSIWRRWRPASPHAVFDDAVDYVRTKARPAAHSLADSAATDPFVLQAVGEIAAAASSAEAMVPAGRRCHRPSGRPRPAARRRTPSPTSPSRSPRRSWWPNG